MTEQIEKYGNKDENHLILKFKENLEKFKYIDDENLLMELSLDNCIKFTKKFYIEMYRSSSHPEINSNFKSNLCKSKLIFYNKLKRFVNTLRDIYRITENITKENNHNKNFLLRSALQERIIDMKNVPIFSENKGIIFLSYLECKYLKIHDSSTSPLEISFITSENCRKKFLYKKGDDLTYDYTAIELIRYISQKINIDILTYTVIPFNRNEGVIEIIESNHIFDNCDDDYLSTTINKKISEIWSDLSNTTKCKELNISKILRNPIFIESFAFYTVIIYILGVGDRNLHNVLITDKGEFFHIDYSFILGKDPKKIILNDKSRFFIPPNVKKALNDEQFCKLRILERIKRIFFSIRDNYVSIYKYINLKSKKDIYFTLDPNILHSLIKERLMIGLSDSLAELNIENKWYSEIESIKSNIACGINILAKYFKN